ncbi:aspartate/glutamate racemase family protein [Phenylobacterium sp. LH3H17]|uniref:aspartate/glutamate racemase family protein n=1 Tax=Phenylobacterium sp. LH3H17 TaxID=2903901 RepID=UPI0020C9D1F7|nr:aspartate/glutamate racemase family protein [Phenylobacterium sp. LH3H17]UTP38151.1 aspartate/glutamate racemase family protein [Phenylobacterium sp. LH3H17]
MRTLGLLGGMSAESTTTYYQALNQQVRQRLGGLHSAQLVLWSVDFAPIAAMQVDGDWDGAGAALADAAARLEGAGAEAILLCTNTMHRVAPAIEARLGIPLIHIGVATARAVRARGCSQPLLLATRFTMEQDFYKHRLRDHGVEPLVPDQADRDRLHAIIYDELCQGVVDPGSKREALAMIARAQGADSVIFGCTEVGLLLSQADIDLPVIDSTLVHVEAGVDFMLG